MVPGSFEVCLPWSDQRLTVAPQTTAIQAVQADGVAVEPSCQVSACGLCMMTYGKGDVIHKDACLNAEERARYFWPCVSRAASQIFVSRLGWMRRNSSVGGSGNPNSALTD
jgi:hypothetical protein